MAVAVPAVRVHDQPSTLREGERVRLLMVVFPEAAEEDVRALLDQAGAPGWTEVRKLVGRGESGLRLGDRIWPGYNSAFLCAVPADVADQIVAALRDYLAAHSSPRGSAFAMRLFSLPCEVLI
ncbi:MAG: hypothetical protein KatS3mg060_3043 [Dehalococcoidia bacterium]|nr:MAG: hypothetical protein KatS3mg060_3043 [Dehalococcoidia bacterium]